MSRMGILVHSVGSEHFLLWEEQFSSIYTPYKPNISIFTSHHKIKIKIEPLLAWALGRHTPDLCLRSTLLKCRYMMKMNYPSILTFRNSCCCFLVNVWIDNRVEMGQVEPNSSELDSIIIGSARNST